MNEISNSKLKGLFWLSLGILVAGLIAVGLPALVAKIPWSIEKKWATRLGETSAIESCSSPAGDAALKKLLASVYPSLPNDQQIDIDLHIAKGDVINAFAHLGGQIFIYQGLLSEADSADEIAGILAHEISHVVHRHILQGLATRLLTFGALHVIFSGQLGTGGEILNLLLNLRFTREQEAEADHEGLLRLQKASISTLGYAHFFKKLEKLSNIPDFISDHPPSELRAEEAKRINIEKPIEVLTQDEWQSLKHICKRITD